MRTRAERRANNKRVKKKFLKGLLSWGWGFDEDWCHKYANENYNNRKACSCWMCRNPRKVWNEKTMQERKFEAVSSNSRIVGS